MSDHFSMKRENMEIEEMSMHHVEIKKEPQDFNNVGELRDPDLDNSENLKEEASYPENQIKKSEQISNETDNGNVDIEEEKLLKKKKPKKKSMKSLWHVDLPEPPAGLLQNYCDLDLSVEFLSQLFEYVNELCDFVNNGDQNVDRSSAVIQNLNNAVSCYQVNLPGFEPTKAIKVTQDQEDFKYEMDLPEYLENDKDCNPRKKIVKKKTNGEKSGLQYTCSICNKTFHKANLSRHMQKFHEEIKNVSCSHCDSSFLKKKELKKHIAEMHKEVKLYACKLCNKSFDFLSYLKKHMESAHEGKVYECKICNKSFQMEVSLKKHTERVHEGKEKDWICTICGSNFFDKHVMDVHIKSVHEGQKPVCTQCGAQFFDNTGLRRHIKTIHERIKPHMCSICGSNFSEKAGLDVHFKRMHNENKEQYACANCDAIFFYKTKLNEHIESTHGIEKSHMCTICDEGFSNGSDLKRHIATVHEGKNLFNCSICNKDFYHKHDLKRHIQFIHEGIRYNCPICDKIFQSENDLKKHLESKTAHVRKKPHTCCVCGKLFRNKALLAVHELIHEEKKGNLEKMERIFPCPHCSYIAAFKTILKNHIKKVHERIKPQDIQLTE